LTAKTKAIRRHDARVLALSALFCWESVKGGIPEAVFQDVVQGFHPDIAPVERPFRLQYAERLFLETIAHLPEIDNLISKASQGWSLSRMPRVDLAILRLAVAEIAYIKDAPLEVVIDEAVELCKEFSTHASPRFVNGVLMGIFRQV
jgi:N utilization substance protein B